MKTIIPICLLFLLTIKAFSQCNGDSVIIYVNTGWNGNDTTPYVWKNRIMHVDTFNLVSQDVRSHVEKTWTGVWQNVSWVEKQYDVQHDIIDQVLHSWVQGNWVNDSRTTRNYSSGVLLSDTNYTFNGTSWVYENFNEYYDDVHGYDSVRIYKEWNGSSFDNIKLFNWTYDSSGMLLTKSEYLWSGSWMNLIKTEYYNDSTIVFAGNGSQWDFQSKTIRLDSTSTLQIIWRFNYVASQWVPVTQQEITHDSIGRTLFSVTLAWNGSSYDSTDHVSYQYSPAGYISYSYSEEYLQNCDCWYMGNGYTYTEELFGDSLAFHATSFGESHCDSESNGYKLYENGHLVFTHYTSIHDICYHLDEGRRDYYFYTDDCSVTGTAGLNENACRNDTLQLHPMVFGGVTGLNYLWYPASGLSDPTIIDPLAFPDSTTTYILMASDSMGHVFYDSLTVYIVQPPAFQLSVTHNGLICGNDSVMLTVNLTPGFDFFWEKTGSGFAGNWGDSSITVSQPGNYYVTAYLANMCYFSSTGITVIKDSLTAAVSATNASAVQVCDGSINIMAAGIPPYLYQWSTGDTTASIDSLCADTYYYTVTDSLGCPFSDSVVVNVQQSVCAVNIINQVNIFCNGECNGSLTAAGTGTAPFIYTWSNSDSSATADSLCAGTYVVTLVDSTGCIATMTAVVNEPPPLAVTAATNYVCGTCTTSAVVTGGTQPYSYMWCDGSNFPAMLSCVPGLCTVLISDANGCLTTDTLTINPPPVITATDSVINASCQACSDGEIIVHVLNGIPPYMITWQGGASTDTIITNLAPGNYNLVIEDANGCTTNVTATVMWSVGMLDLVNKQFAISPNPFSEFTILQLKTSVQHPKGKMVITDVVGNVISSIDVVSEKTMVSRKALAAGAYFYLLYLDDELSGTGKLLITD